MCINCNVLAPLTIQVCDLIGFPRGIFYSNHYNFDILNEFIRSIWCASIKSKLENVSRIQAFLTFEENHPPQLLLLDYIVKHNMLDKVFELFGESPLNPTIPSVTNTYIINAYTHHLFHFTSSSKKSIDDYVYNTTIPLELLSSYPYYIRAGINFRIGSYKQIKPFEEDQDETDKFDYFNTSDFELIKASALYGISVSSV